MADCATSSACTSHSFENRYASAPGCSKTRRSSCILWRSCCPFTATVPAAAQSSASACCCTTGLQQMQVFPRTARCPCKSCCRADRWRRRGRAAGSPPGAACRRARRWLSLQELLPRVPLAPGGLRGGFSYGDAQVDDFRLVRAVVAAAIRDGALVREHTEVEQIRRDGAGG